MREKYIKTLQNAEKGEKGIKGKNSICSNNKNKN
jgi:hypothetical protein